MYRPRKKYKPEGNAAFDRIKMKKTLLGIHNN
jgi:hypothetical protein